MALLDLSVASTPPPRLGAREGWQNVQKAQVHAVATAAMNLAQSSTHENVVGYDPKMLESSCTNEIQLAQPLDSNPSTNPSTTPCKPSNDIAA